MSAIRCLGIIDWGIGGIDFYRKLREKRPSVPTIYFSDSGFTPYGKLSHSALRERLHDIVQWLASRGVSHVVIACNAASTTLQDKNGDLVDSTFTLPCIGVIRPAIAAIKRQFSFQAETTVVVLGGQRTIDSGVYQRALEDCGIPVHTAIAQPLSALVEQGIVDDPRVTRAIREILTGRPRQVDILVPACTHYTALLPELIRQISPRSIVDPAEETLSHLVNLWTFQQDIDGPKRFITTGCPKAMIRSAKRAFSIEIEKASKVADLKRQA